jgi:Ice-binding-like
MPRSLRLRILSFLMIVMLFCSVSVVGIVAIPPLHSQAAGHYLSLGTADSFAVLGATTVTNTGPTVVTGDLGVSPGPSCTGFLSPCTGGPGTVSGMIHVADAVAAQAQADATSAYMFATDQACTTTFSPIADIGGMTLTPGVYCFPSSAGVTGTLTLDAQNNPDAVFIFKIGSTLITASASKVALINGAQTGNVFWQVGSSATLGTTTSFAGSIVALASITATTAATSSCGLYALNGAVTLDSNLIQTCSSSAPSPCKCEHLMASLLNRFRSSPIIFPS